MLWSEKLCFAVSRPGFICYALGRRFLWGQLNEGSVPQGSTCAVCRQLSGSEITPGRGHIASFISISLEPASRTWASHRDEHRPGCPSTLLIKVSVNTHHASDFNRLLWKHFWLHSFFMLRLWVHPNTSTHLINYCCQPHLKEKHPCVVMMELDAI